MRTRIIFIRHGQTDWNIQRRYLGLTDIGLNSEGRKQALKVKRRVEEMGAVDKVYSSDRRRAREFAALIFDGMEVTGVAGLRETDFGVFEGLTYDQILVSYPDIYRAWIDDPMNVTIPRGESFLSVRERALASVSDIVKCNAGKAVAIISHAGPLSVIMKEYAGSNDFWGSWPEPGCISVVEFDGMRPSILLLNDSSHMEGK